MGDGKGVTPFQGYGSDITIDSAGGVLTIEVIEAAAKTVLSQSYTIPTAGVWKINHTGNFTVSSFTYDPLPMPWNASMEEATTIRCLRTLRSLDLLKKEDLGNTAKQTNDFGDRMRAHVRRNIKMKKIPRVREHPFKKFQDPTMVGKQFSPRLKFKK